MEGPKLKQTTTNDHRFRLGLGFGVVQGFFILEMRHVIVLVYIRGYKRGMVLRQGRFRGSYSPGYVPEEGSLYCGVWSGDLTVVLKFRMGI